MDRRNPFRIHKLGQIFSDPDNTCAWISRDRIRKFLLGMGMKDQDFRFTRPRIDLHRPVQQIVGVQLFRSDHRRTVHNIKIAEQIVKIS